MKEKEETKKQNQILVFISFMLTFLCPLYNKKNKIKCKEVRKIK